MAMKRMQQLVSCYLALCLVGGGAVGINPVLHRLIEHGGHGPAHTHISVAPRAASTEPLHQHGNGQLHSHAPARPYPAGLFEHSYTPPGFPKISLSRLWRGITQLFEAAASPDSAPSKDSPGHEHHSLFQLLASGLVDQPIDVPILASVPASFVSYEFPATTPFVARDWDAQTASRGPPSSRS